MSVAIKKCVAKSVLVKRKAPSILPVALSILELWIQCVGNAVHSQGAL